MRMSMGLEARQQQVQKLAPRMIQRAEAVAAYLNRQGVAADRMDLQSYGPDRPVDRSQTGKAYRKNRRVEIKIAPLTQG